MTWRPDDGSALMSHSLTESELGTLILSPENGYVVKSYDLGVPAPRVISAPTTGTDGDTDLTAYAGPRAVAFAIALDGNMNSQRALRDRLAAYLQPDRRVTYTFIEPYDDLERQMTLRGAGGASPVAHPKFNAMAATFSCPTGLIEGVTQKSVTMLPNSLVELGRTYDRTYDRTYAASPPAGYTVTNIGTKAAHWRCTLYGPMTNPTLRLGLKPIVFAGLTLVAGQSLVIESRGRQVYFDDGANTPALEYVNLAATTWWVIPGGDGITPGSSQVSLSAASYSGGASAVLTWYDTWT